MTKNKNEEAFSATEARHRFEAALRGARLAGHKAHEDVKVKKSKPKKDKSPRRPKP